MSKMSDKDTIYRQDAIDAIEKTYGSIAYQEDGFTRSDAIDILKSLPSTQSEIIRCKDCKHYNAGFECLIEGYGIEREKDWYCADAERRNNG